MKQTHLIVLALASLCFSFRYNEDTKSTQDTTSHSAKYVISRLIGKENANRFQLKIDKSLTGNDTYTIKKTKKTILITGNTQVALCRGTYDYLKNACNSLVSWSGKRIAIPATLPEYAHSGTSPYYYRYYFNVVTHGYSTPYWDWQRWEKEIDWMAIHGINMPLLSGAHEAILYRVFEKIGLNDDEINSYFSGPAYLPWNRMGNLNKWGGPLPKDFYRKQIALNHQILQRVKELGMHPIIPAFAGFVPKNIQRIYPSEKLRELKWGGELPDGNQAYILEPNSELFAKIGKLYIAEWEKEFGKAELYLADSFNEMDVPVSADTTIAKEELSSYGQSIFKPLNEANPNAKWVIQGWTFPFQKDKSGNLFWTPNRLKALFSKIPDDKMLILDLANEYNRLWWKIDPSWKMYDGFFGKQWVYSFVPNMGAKGALNGNLNLYATMPKEALAYKDKKNLVGFGFAPEGIENNEIIYELLSDVAWERDEIDLKNWLQTYSIQRYGEYSSAIQESLKLQTESCYGSFTAHPRFRYQLHPNIDFNSLVFDFQSDVHNSKIFTKAAEIFLKDRNKLKKSLLYQYDAIELVAQFLGLKADEALGRFREDTLKNKPYLIKGLKILAEIDQLLATHPNHQLSKWVNFARNFGDSEKDKKYYEANAKRIITTWGKGFSILDDYSARMWNGLIADYYLKRWKLYYNYPKNIRDAKSLEWEEKWINTPWKSTSKPLQDPIESAYKLFMKYSKNN